jgi:hypothetical protein
MIKNLGHLWIKNMKGITNALLLMSIRLFFLFFKFISIPRDDCLNFRSTELKQIEENFYNY